MRRPRLQRYHAIVIGLAVALPGCGNVDRSGLGADEACGDPRSAPRLVLRDSITLRESDSLYVGNPAGTFAVDDSGRIYIADAATNRLLGFRADGTPSLVFGGPGAGPGEFRGIAFAGGVAGDLVFQGDYRLRRINLYDQSASYLGQIAYTGRLTWLHVAEDRLWVGLPDQGVGLAVTHVALPSASIAAPDTAGEPIQPTMISLPAEYAEYQVLGAGRDDIKLVAWSDTVVVGFGGLEYVVRYRRDGTPIDTASVPVCRRQGSPRDLLDQWFRNRPQTAEEQRAFDLNAESRISGLLGMWRLQAGEVLVWYQDAWRDAPSILRGRAWLAVLSPDLSKACVDAELAAPGSGRSRLTVQGNDVVLLDQVIEESAAPPTVRSVLRRYTVDTRNCRWQATRPAPKEFAR